MPKLFIAGIAIFLLLGAGYGISQAARATPWDCSDWQAFVHDDRATAILESLAENRGKTLYCGVDQSDTFAKAETWEAGKDRNERDDTVYFGERGQFRGFIAAQEGWLTDGESGITGQSESVIFEFPKEERRIRRVKRITVGTDPEQFPINAATSCDQVLGILCTSEHASGSWVNANAAATARNRARNSAVGLPGINHTNYHVTWDTNLVYTDTAYTSSPRGNPERTARYSTAWWENKAAEAAGRACRARGARPLASSVAFGMGHGENRGPIANDNGPGLGFLLRTENHETLNNVIKIHGRQSRTWTATCKKVIRRSR